MKKKILFLAVIGMMVSILAACSLIDKSIQVERKSGIDDISKPIIVNHIGNDKLSTDQLTLEALQDVNQNKQIKLKGFVKNISNKDLDNIELMVTAFLVEDESNSHRILISKLEEGQTYSFDEIYSISQGAELFTNLPEDQDFNLDQVEYFQIDIIEQ